MEYDLIKSGKEAIVNSIEAAMKLYEVTEIEREKSKSKRVMST